jgi:hypothetical protein
MYINFVKSQVEFTKMSWYKKAGEDSLAASLQRKIQELLNSVNLELSIKTVRQPCKSCPNSIPKVLLGKINGFDIFIINGDLVKTKLEMDFVEGANDQAYGSETNPDNKDVVPENEVWLSSEVFPQHIPYILYHELIEANIMKDTGADYSSSHSKANEYERIARKAKLFG